jgi:hypothetical protein
MERAGERAPGRLDLLGQVVQRGEHPARVLGRTLAQWGDDDLARRTLDELRVQRLLQCRDRTGEGRLTGADGCRGLAEVPVLGHRHEGPELGDRGRPGLGALGIDNWLRSDGSGLAISPISTHCATLDHA